MMVLLKLNLLVCIWKEKDGHRACWESRLAWSLPTSAFAGSTETKSWLTAELNRGSMTNSCGLLIFQVGRLFSIARCCPLRRSDSSIRPVNLVRVRPLKDPDRCHSVLAKQNC